MRLRSALCVAFVLALAPAARAAVHHSLPHVSSGHRPGPSVLYAPPPRAPQLENTGVWHAHPLLVSGATAYRDGEFLYQDWLHDDRGAAGLSDVSDTTSFSFKPHAGTLTYPTDPVFARNAADLVELRVKPLTHATAFRVTLDTLEDPARTAFTIAIGSSATKRQWPHDARVSSPARYFLTVHGATAELRDATTGLVVGPAATATVDLGRRQITAVIDHRAWNPGRGTVRLAAGVGLWDRAAGRYLVPGPTATATTPGGGGSASGSGLFNLAFRGSEPLPTGPAPGATIVDTTITGNIRPAWWRELSQSQALASGDVSRFAANVDFGKLRDRARDDSKIPTTGAIDRIFASHLSFGQGVDTTKLCGRQPAHCDGAFVGQLQAYTVYVPPGKPRPRSGRGLTLLLHALNENENEFDGSAYQRQLGERGRGYLVVTPSSRGPDGDYTDAPEANVFETWADVARHYRLDPSRVTVSGFSMGGGAVYRLLSRWPDLFARGAAVGAATNADQTGAIAALHNTPILSWVGAEDEGTTPNLQLAAIDNQTKLGLDWIFDTFPTADHLTIPTNDQFAPFASFLGGAQVRRDHPRLVFGVVGAHDFARAGVVADHVGWLSGLRARDHAATGSIDATSRGFAAADPRPTAVEQSAGILAPGRLGRLSYAERRMGRAAPAKTRPRDRLDLRAANLSAATVDARRARLGCAPTLSLADDSPLSLGLVCRAARPTRCARTLVLRVPRLVGARIAAVRVRSGRRTLRRARGRDVRRVRVRRPSRRAFTLHLRASAPARGILLDVRRRYPACRRTP